MGDSKILVEVRRIHEIMNINSELILEQPSTIKLTKELLDFVGGNIKKYVSVPKGKSYSGIRTDISKLQQKLNTNVNLTDAELSLLVKYIDWGKIANSAISKPDLLGNSFVKYINTSLNLVSKNPKLKKKKLEVLQGFIDNDYPDLPLQLRTQIKDLIEQKFDDAVGTKTDNIPGRIIPDNSIPVPKNNIKKLLDRITQKNLQTIKRIVTRSMSSQEKLNQEFLEVAKQSAYYLSQGKSGNYYYKKMSDILLSKKKSFDDGITEMYNVLSKDPNIPNDVKKAYSKSQFYTDITKNPETSILKPWMNLLWPWSNKNIGEWIQRVAMFIAQQNPMTSKEIVLNLQKSGLKGFLLKRVAAGYFAKFLFAPLLFGIIKTILAIPVELYKIAFDDEYVNPWGPKGEQEWKDAIKNNIMTGFGGINPSWTSLIPISTLVDDMWVAAKKVNRFTHDLYDDENTSLADKYLGKVKEKVESFSSDLFYKKYPCYKNILNVNYNEDGFEKGVKVDNPKTIKIRTSNNETYTATLKTDMNWYFEDDTQLKC